MAAMVRSTQTTRRRPSAGARAARARGGHWDGAKEARSRRGEPKATGSGRSDEDPARARRAWMRRREKRRASPDPHVGERNGEGWGKPLSPRRRLYFASPVSISTGALSLELCRAADSSFQLMAIPGDQSAGCGSEARDSKLRYPLRSASRGKAAPPAVDAPPTGSAPRRAKPSSDVSKSMCVLDLSSVKDKSAKPPRRHSIQTKPGASPRPTPTGTITPVSSVRSRRSLGKFDTPTSDVSMSIARRKFSTLSSISYWMTQIRLAEAASKHTVSLGFFKLALESECEPVDRMREELKAYVVRHGLTTELEEPVKDILQVYDIMEDFEKLKISADSSQQPKKSDKAARSATNVSPKGNLKPRSLNSDATQNKEAGKKENIQKEKPEARVRGSYNRNPAKNAPAKQVVAKNTVKKTKKRAKGQQEDCNGGSEALPVGPEQESVDVKEITHEDKENMGDTEMPMDADIAQEV